MKTSGHFSQRILFSLAVIVAGFFATTTLLSNNPPRGHGDDNHGRGDDDEDRNEHAQVPDPVLTNASRLIVQGRTTFRFDTYGDQAFWGDTLKLHLAIEGANLGGIGPGLSPSNALALGLKVDADALPRGVIQQIRSGKLDITDPAVTVALLKLNAVVGVIGFFSPSNNNALSSVGLTCAICHSTVN